MEKRRFGQAILFPLLAIVMVAAYAGGLGIVFTVLNEQVIKEWAVVALGVVITVCVPAAAALLERRVERS